MDTSDKPVLPVVAKLQDAVDAIEGMLAENRARRDMVASLPAESQEQENERLARERGQIDVLGKILEGLAAAVLATIREKSYDAMASKLHEALHVAKGMLAECKKANEMLSGLPPERQQAETQKLHSDLEYIGALVKIVDGITDGVIEGQRAAAEKPPIDAQ